ncbi:MAG: hypothetical protein C0473_03000 [Cyanobacteria bacterium DS3.002]|nr:hypothetical protein [Cyanobacteria bacterium DS3.002]MBA4049845.1 hypothetical protein [Cyanobacteria bacterium DS2.008]
MITDHTVVIAQPASLRQRFLAACIDEILLVVVMLVLFLPSFLLIGQYFLSGGDGYGASPENIPFWLWAAFTVFTLSYPFPYFYSAMFEASRLSATPGKLLLGLKVVSERNERITVSDGLTKALAQTMVYIPTVVFCFLLIVLFINIMGFAIDKKVAAIIGLFLDIIFPFFAIAALSYPCFRNGSQSSVDLISHRFVVERNAPQEYTPQPLEKFESAIHFFYVVPSAIFWVLAILVVLSIPLLLYTTFCMGLSNELGLLGFCLLIFSWPTGLWLIWKYRKRSGTFVANAAAVLLTNCLIANVIIYLPEFVCKVSNTPITIAFVDKAIVASKSGDKNNYESLRLQAKSQPSFALSYYALRYHISGELLGLKDQATSYCAPRIWAITSGPGVPLKEAH